MILQSHVYSHTKPCLVTYFPPLCRQPLPSSFALRNGGTLVSSAQQQPPKLRPEAVSELVTFAPYPQPLTNPLTYLLFGTKPD